MKSSMRFLIFFTVLATVSTFIPDLLMPRCLPKFELIKDKAITDRYMKISYEILKQEATMGGFKAPQDLDFKYYSTARGLPGKNDPPPWDNIIFIVIFNFIDKRSNQREKMDKIGVFLHENGTFHRITYQFQNNRLIYWNEVPEKAAADRYLKIALDAYKAKIKTNNFEYKVLCNTEIHFGGQVGIHVVIYATIKESKKKQQAVFLIDPNGSIIADKVHERKDLDKSLLFQPKGPFDAYLFKKIYQLWLSGE